MRDTTRERERERHARVAEKSLGTTRERKEEDAPPILICDTHWASRSSDRARLAILPLFAAAQIALGAAFGSTALAALRVKCDKEDYSTRELRALCSFGNSGPLPFVFADGFFRGAADATLLPRAVAYISFYLVGWSPLFWTLGPGMLEEPRPRSDDAVALSAIQRAREAVQRVASPPVVAALGGVAVGCNGATRALLIAENAPLRPLLDALRTIGGAYLPCVALVLAGALYRSFNAAPPPPSSVATDAAVPAAATAAPTIARWRRLALLGVCRFAYMPLASFGLLRALDAAPAWFPLALRPTDPLMRFVLLMASAMPSAQNAIVILQLGDQSKADKAPAESMAKTLAFLYIAAVLPMACLLSLALQLAPLTLV